MSEPREPDPTRRPLKTRNARWAGALAAWLARAGVSPNAISVASIGFAVVAAAAFVGTIYIARPIGDSLLFLAAVVGIQGRLLCNMLDGMVAVEGGKRTPTGELFNEVPDRVADTLILVAAGYAADPTWGPTLGWIAALLAMFTAYVRATGRAAGAQAHFVGPMAKPHRMALLTGGCVASALAVFKSSAASTHPWLTGVLIAIAVGSLITVVRRLMRINADLRVAFSKEP